MVMVLDAKVADTPFGKPIGVPIAMSPVVGMVIFVNGELIHKIGVDDGAPTVFAGVTVIVPVAFAVPQPPVKGIL